MCLLFPCFFYIEWGEIQLFWLLLLFPLLFLFCHNVVSYDVDSVSHLPQHNYHASILGFFSLVFMDRIFLLMLLLVLLKLSKVRSVCKLGIRMIMISPGQSCIGRLTLLYFTFISLSTGSQELPCVERLTSYISLCLPYRCGYFLSSIPLWIFFYFHPFVFC